LVGGRSGHLGAADTGWAPMPDQSDSVRAAGLAPIARPVATQGRWAQIVVARVRDGPGSAGACRRSNPRLVSRLAGWGDGPLLMQSARKGRQTGFGGASEICRHGGGRPATYRNPLPGSDGRIELGSDESERWNGAHNPRSQKRRPHRNRPLKSVSNSASQLRAGTLSALSMPPHGFRATAARPPAADQC
jgi:hypothetical protein